MKNRIAAVFFSGVLVAGAIAIAGCGSSQASEAQSPVAANGKHAKHNKMSQDASSKCPMKVEGTTARAEASDGVAVLAFSTTGDVAELQSRVENMATMHKKHHGSGDHAHMAGMKKPDTAGQDHAKHSAHKMEGEHSMAMPASSAKSEATENGARIVLTPSNPVDLEKLRAHVEKMAAKMAGGDCPMMAPADESADLGKHVHPSAN